MLADAPGEDELVPVTLVHRAADDLPAVALLEVGIRVLHEHAAANAPVVAGLRVGAATLGVEQDPSALLLPQRFEGCVVVAG